MTVLPLLCALAEPSESQQVADAPEGFGFPMSSLYTFLCSPPCTDQTTLLLYLLVHKNTAFRHYVLSRTDLDALVSGGGGNVETRICEMFHGLMGNVIMCGRTLNCGRSRMVSGFVI